MVLVVLAYNNFMQQQDQQPTPENLLRERLLDALDTEIDTIISAQAATGRTRWALLLSLAALLWLGLQAWENTMFVMSNVLLLAITMSIIWDFLLKMSNSIDGSLISSPARQGRFLALSGFLGALRSTILFHAAKLTLALATIICLHSPELVILKLYLVGPEERAGIWWEWCQAKRRIKVFDRKIELRLQNPVERNDANQAFWHWPDLVPDAHAG